MNMIENHFYLKFAEYEVNPLFIIQHPNIVSFQEHFNQKNKFSIVMKFMDDGDFESKIKVRKTPFEEQVILDVFAQLASTLQKYKRKDIVHIGIKPANILITSLC
jgi:serine/threonine protein kinase